MLSSFQKNVKIKGIKRNEKKRGAENMKKYLFIVAVFILVGCETEQIKSFVRDPHYAQYQEKLDDLEQTYLKKEISYAQYLEQKKEIDDNYSKEVQEREDIIHSR